MTIGIDQQNIKSKDFSIVIQGPIIKDYTKSKTTTIDCINSVRKILPESEIILSTWEGEDVSSLEADKFIFNIDPGAVSYNNSNFKNTFNNNNRQIVSTFNGLKVAERKYAIKMRGDCIMNNNSFLTFLNGYPQQLEFQILEQKVLVLSTGTRDVRRIPIMCHVCDLVQIGLTKDLISIWDIPLQKEPETTQFKPEGYSALVDPYPQNNYRFRYASEQYIIVEFARKFNIDFSLDFYTDLSLKKLLISEEFIISNFISVEPHLLGFTIPERILKSVKPSQTISYEKWIRLYTKYKHSNKFFVRLNLIVAALASRAWYIRFKLF